MSDSTYRNTSSVPQHIFTKSGIAEFYVLAPRSRGLPEKLIGPQLVIKFPAFYGNPELHHRIHKSPPPVSVLSQIDPIHALKPRLGRFILVLPSHQRLGVSSGFVPSGFPNKTL
jgi:hypothetical protein